MTEFDDIIFALRTELAGAYSFESELGRGGMGVVWLARDVSLDRPVAIKILRPDRAANPEQRERFLREARTGARLAHPNVVPIYAVGEAAGTVYFVMEFIDGESLGARLHRDGPMPAADASRIARDIGLALAHAHAMGILHRDVTIDNVLIDRNTGRAMLADFGIAADIESADSAPLIGTPAYLAPELIHGEAPSPQSDLYALGVVTWTMLTGRLPFPEADVAQVLIHHMTSPIPSLADAAAATPRRLQRGVEHCLAKSPADRPPDVEAWLGELRAEDPGTALSLPLAQWLDRWQDIRVFYALGASITALLWLLNLPLYLPSTGLKLLDQIVALIWPAVYVLPLVLPVHLAMEWRSLRKVARAGYRLEDLQLAIGRKRSQLLRERRADSSLIPRIVRALTVTALLLWLAIPMLFFPALRRYRFFWIYSDLFSYGAEIIRWSYIMFWSGTAYMLINPPFQLHPAGWFARLSERAWGSWFGDLCLRFASVLLPRGTAAEHTLHRPTELVLGLAIEDLWNGLPPETRERFAEIPSLALALRRQTGELRVLLTHCDRPNITRSPDADALRQILLGREQQAIRALERLRIRLLELTVEGRPDGELTRELDDVRSAHAGLLAELGADGQILARLLRDSSRRSPSTPTPTPALTS